LSLKPGDPHGHYHKENPMPRRSKSRRTTTTAIAALTARFDRVSGDSTCVATILPLIGLAMRCRRPCGRCAELAAEVERLRPEWDAAKAEYHAALPDKAPRKPTTTPNQNEEEPWA
jgi:hypothetical protein